MPFVPLVVTFSSNTLQLATMLAVHLEKRRVDTTPIIVNEITLVGSRCGRFEPALNLLKMGKVNVTDMISESMPLADARRAFARAGERGVLKVLLQG